MSDMAKYQIRLQDVFYEIARVLKALYPNGELKVYQERIADLKTPSMSIELVQFSSPQFSQSVINKRVDLDIVYFSESDTVFEALAMVEPLMGAFSMGLTVYERDDEGELVREEDGSLAYKRFIHCLRAPEYTLVDQDLHFMVSFEFADSFVPLYVTLDEAMVDGQRAGKRPIVTAYNTGKETLENKEILFEDDGDDAKHAAYIDEGYRLMDDLFTGLNTMYASFEL